MQRFMLLTYTEGWVVDGMKWWKVKKLLNVNSKPMKISWVNKAHVSPITKLGGPHQQKLTGYSKIMSCLCLIDWVFKNGKHLGLVICNAIINFLTLLWVWKKILMCILVM
jgi:hypothetical protein